MQVVLTTAAVSGAEFEPTLFYGRQPCTVPHLSEYSLHAIASLQNIFPNNILIAVLSYIVQVWILFYKDE